MGRPAASLLKDSHPKLAEQLVERSLVDTLSTGSNAKVFWRCEKGHEYEARVYNRTSPVNPTGCPVCSGKKVLVGHNDIATTDPEVAMLCANSDDAFKYTRSSNKKLDWRCEKGHVWNAPVARLTIQGSRCPYCSGRLPIPGETDLATTHPDLAAQLVDTSLGTKLKAGSHRKVKWRCDAGHIYEAMPNNRALKGKGCPYCTGRLPIVGETDFATLHPEYARTLVHEEDGQRIKTQSDAKVEWRCQQNPNHTWLATPANRLASPVDKGCPYCANKKIIPGENDLGTLFPEIAAELVDGSLATTLAPHAGDIVEWGCDQGHRWYASVAHRTAVQGTGCPECSLVGVSEAERNLAANVAQLLPGCDIIRNDTSVLPGRYELDIVIPQRKVAIEYNGCRWHCDVAGKGRDYHKMKMEMAKTEGYHLLQVWEDDWIHFPDAVLYRLSQYLEAEDVFYSMHPEYGVEVTESLVYGSLMHERVAFGEAKTFMSKHSVDTMFDDAVWHGWRDEYGALRVVMGVSEVSTAERVWRIDCLAYLGKLGRGFDGMLQDAMSDIDFEGAVAIQLQAMSDNCMPLRELYEKSGFVFVGDVLPRCWYVGNSNKWVRNMHGSNDDDLHALYDAGAEQWVFLTNAVVAGMGGSLRNVDVLALPRPDSLSGTNRSISKYVRYYQQDVFYEREKKAWSQNATHKDKPLRDFLIENRVKYLGKREDELTVAQLLMGFRISGVVHGYSMFDTKLMSQVIDKYGISSVYDPCAGWGERLLYCATHNVVYHGVDINAALKPGYDALIFDLELSEQVFEVGDSSVVVPMGRYDAVVTCPPYGSLEYYSSRGAENFEETRFLMWWASVVSNCLKANPRLFCFQINQTWRDKLAQVVEDCGGVLLDEFAKDNRVSHFARSAGTKKKRNFESMLVFEMPSVVGFIEGDGGEGDA